MFEGTAVAVMKRMVGGELMNEELAVDRSLRPRSLAFFTGQRAVCANLDVFIKRPLPVVSLLTTY